MPVVNREVVLPVPRERAWELITEPAELEEWLGEDIEFEPEVDAPVRVDEREGFVEEVDDLERIVFRWGDSRVEWVLTDDPAGTRFIVTERQIVAEPLWGEPMTVDSTVWGPKLSALSSASTLCLA
jgi:uncharacterized protein YndB with AHSA1/START domain